MGLTSKQRKILEVLSRNDAKETASQLGVSVNDLHVSNTLVFQNFSESLNVMLDYFPIFERRLRARDPELYTKLRRLASKIHKEIS